jgi:hypothetical protein
MQRSGDSASQSPMRGHAARAKTSLRCTAPGRCPHQSHFCSRLTPLGRADTRQLPLQLRALNDRGSRKSSLVRSSAPLRRTRPSPYAKNSAEDELPLVRPALGSHRSPGGQHPDELSCFPNLRFSHPLRSIFSSIRTFVARVLFKRGPTRLCVLICNGVARTRYARTGAKDCRHLG